MNILLITGSDINDQNSTSSFKRILLNELVKQGHSITLVYSYRDKIFKKYNVTSSSNVKHVSGTRFYLKEYIPNKIYHVLDKQLVRRKKKWKMQYPEKFISKVQKKLDGEYDLVLSISHPVYSHRIALELIKQNKITYNRWYQIWFETWYDIFNIAKKSVELKQDEVKLLRHCDRIIYSSQLLLDNHSKIYPSFNKKMRMFNLPSYPVLSNNTEQTYTLGYFGNYSSKVREFGPFYESIKILNLPTVLVGKGDYEIQSNEHIKSINQRIPEKECELYEKQTQILVVLCNWFADIIPGKLYKYATWDKPILVILDGSENMKNYILNTFGKHEKFYFCENNEEAITEEIDKITKDLKKMKYFPITEFLPEKIVSEIISEDF